MCSLCMHEAVLHIQCCQICNFKRWLGISLSWGTTCSSVFPFLHWRWKQHLAVYLPGPQSLITAQELLGCSCYTMNMIFSSSPHPTLPTVTINQWAHRTPSLIGWPRRHGWSVCKTPRFANIHCYCSCDVTVPWES